MNNLKLNNLKLNNLKQKIKVNLVCQVSNQTLNRTMLVLSDKIMAPVDRNIIRSFYPSLYFAIFEKIYDGN